MMVTIYTDANPWAWAFWARSSKGRLRDYGYFKKKMNEGQSGAFELEAIKIAIKRVIQRWPETSGFYIKSDNEHALRMIHDIMKPTKYVTFCTHVRGHQNPNKNAEAYLNDWCDKQVSSLKYRATHRRHMAGPLDKRRGR